MAAEQPIVVRIAVDSAAAEAALQRTGTGMESLAARAKTTGTALTTHGRSAVEAARATDSLSFASHGAQRELLVLAHELSQGNFKGFAGSMLVLAERTGAASLLMSPLAVAIGSVVAVVGGFAIAAYQGAQAQNEFNKSLIATGNYAGVTEDSLASLTSRVAQATSSGKVAAEDAAQAIVSTGRFGPAVIEQATQATLAMAKVTGKSADDIAKDFASMGDGVAKWAAKNNQSYHYLTVEQFKYIKQLEDQGKLEEAEAENLRLLNEHFVSLKPKIGSLSEQWQELSHWASEAWASMRGNGKDITVGQQIDTLRERIAQREANPGRGEGSAADKAKLLDGLRQELYLLTEKQRLQNKSAAMTAADAAANEKAIKKITDAPAASKASDSTAAFDSFISTMKQRAVVAQAELDTYGKLSEADKFRAETLEKIEGKESKLTAAQRIEAFVQEALTEQVLRANEARKHEDELRKERIKNIVQETANAEAQRQKVYGIVESGNDLVRGIVEQTEALGLNAEEQQRLTEMRKLDNAVAAAMVGATSDTRTEILALAEVMRRNLNGAIDASIERQAALTAASREFSTGAAEAIKRFQDDTANGAALASRVVDGGLSRATDALTTFVETGKLKLGDLWSFMADEFIRQQARMAVSQATSGNGLLGLVGTIGSLFNGSYNVNYGNEGRNYPAPTVATTQSVGRASAQSVSAAGILASVASSSSQRAQAESAGGGGNVYITNTYANAEVTAQRDRNGDFQVLVQEVTNRVVGVVASDIASGAGRVSTAMRSRGVNLGGGVPRRS